MMVPIETSVPSANPKSENEIIKFLSSTLVINPSSTPVNPLASSGTPISSVIGSSPNAVPSISET